MFELFRQRAASTIDGATARELVNAGARLVDVRSPEEYASGHIDGAINIPLADIERGRAGEVSLAPTSTPTVVYCRSGQRSARARRRMIELGYASVYDLGPMSAW